MLEATQRRGPRRLPWRIACLSSTTATSHGTARSPRRRRDARRSPTPTRSSEGGTVQAGIVINHRTADTSCANEPATLSMNRKRTMVTAIRPNPVTSRRPEVLPNRARSSAATRTKESGKALAISAGHQGETQDIDRKQLAEPHAVGEVGEREEYDAAPTLGRVTASWEQSSRRIEGRASSRSSLLTHNPFISEMSQPCKSDT